MDYPVLAGCGLTRLDAAKVLPPVLLVCQRGCKRSANPLQRVPHQTAWFYIRGPLQGSVSVMLLLLMLTQCGPCLQTWDGIYYFSMTISSFSPIVRLLHVPITGQSAATMSNDLRIFKLTVPKLSPMKPDSRKNI